MKNNYQKNKPEKNFNQKFGDVSAYDYMMPNQGSASMGSGDFQASASVDDYSIQLRDYLLDRDQRGSNLNNWLN